MVVWVVLSLPSSRSHLYAGVDVCLEKKEEIFGREAGAWCLGIRT